MMTIIIILVNPRRHTQLLFGNNTMRIIYEYKISAAKATITRAMAANDIGTYKHTSLH